jgi:hypothetical protein|tara:strand:+ start:7143 stop:7637 length:495 start_codon:yes stop_codon:yes gene_type:complete
MAEKNIVDTAIIHRTRYEIETFVLGEHPHPARQAQLLINEIRRVRAGVVIESGEHAKAGLEAELKILEDILADMSQKHDVPALLENIETYEEQYWVDRLARMAAIDILTIGKIQPDHMNRIAALNDTAFANCVKTTANLAKLLNDGVVQAERQLSQDMVPQDMM